jgi:hypothetical protein
MAYRTAKNTKDLVEKLKAVLRVAHEKATAADLSAIVEGLHPHVDAHDAGAFYSAVHIADTIGERPAWLSDAVWRRTVDGESTAKGRHSRPAVAGEDLAAAYETLVTFQMIKEANRLYDHGHRFGNAMAMTATLVNASIDTVKKRIRVAKKLNLPTAG